MHKLQCTLFPWEINTGVLCIGVHVHMCFVKEAAARVCWEVFLIESIPWENWSHRHFLWKQWEHTSFYKTVFYWETIISLRAEILFRKRGHSLFSGHWDVLLLQMVGCCVPVVPRITPFPLVGQIFYSMRCMMLRSWTVQSPAKRSHINHSHAFGREPLMSKILKGTIKINLFFLKGFYEVIWMCVALYA